MDEIFTDYGDLVACASLTLRYASGQEFVVLTRTDWGATLGQTRSSNWTGGEDFDAGVDLDTTASGVRDGSSWTWPHGRRSSCDQRTCSKMTAASIRVRTAGPVYHTVRTGRRPLTWHPRFCYNGLRYLEIAGLEEPLRPQDVRGLVIAADVRATGEFSCSDQMLNQVHRLVRRAVTSNMYSVFTDCP